MTQTLQLKGRVPSSKNGRNLITIKGRPRSVPNRDTVRLMEALQTQAQAQWPHEAIESPDMRVTFYAKAARQDRDNMLNALMDVLVKAGVLVNDNIKRCNGNIHIEPAVVGEEEGVEVELTWHEG